MIMQRILKILISLMLNLNRDMEGSTKTVKNQVLIALKEMIGVVLRHFIMIRLICKEVYFSWINIKDNIRKRRLRTSFLELSRGLPVLLLTII